MEKPANFMHKIRQISLNFLLFFISWFVIQNAHADVDKQTLDLKIGERLFHGLIPMGENKQACASCHLFQATDTMNWNPSAVEMARKAAGMDLLTFKEHLLQPSGVKRGVVHANYSLTNTQLSQLHGYLKSLAKDDVAEEKRSISNLLVFLLLGVLMALALVDLIFTKKIKFKLLHLLILGLGLAIHGKMIYTESTRLGRSEDYAPDQPIKFSHKVHATDNKIDCLYCHSNAEHGKSAGIPGPGLCMNCHMIVRNGTHSGQFEIAKVVEHYDNKEPIDWVRVHNLPDHVYFNHSQHVKVAGLDCTKCHGNVEDMHILKQEEDLSMGFCVNCHRETKVNFDENGYYQHYHQLHDDLATGKRDSIMAVDIGANDCMKCHY
jgi:hypothetical protein